MAKSLGSLKLLLWVGIVLFLLWFLLFCFGSAKLLANLSFFEAPGFMLRLYGIFPLSWAVLFFLALKDVQKNIIVINGAIITGALVIISIVAYHFVFKATGLFHWISRVVTQLRFAALSGIPELSKEKYPGKLLTEGVYSRVRNPRYIEALLWVTAYALFANYLGAYIVVVLSLPLIYFVVRLEERELRARFGTAYEEYCRRVPRFVPKPRPRND